MTMSSAVSKVTLNGDGSQTSWPFSFKVWKADDLEVILTSPGGTESVTTDWSVVLSGIGGTLTYPVLGDTLPTGWKITIRRSMDFLQEVDLVSGTRWDPEVVETALDQAAAERQQLLEEIGRSVRIGVASTEDPTQVVNQVFLARDQAAASAGAAATSESNAATSESNAADSAAAAQTIVNNAALSNMPIGAVSFFTGVNAPAGWVVGDGGLKSRAAYPDLWAFAQASGNISVDDASWTFGQYSPGDGSTTFRVPKVDDRFIRGKSATRPVGLVEEDQFKSHTHTTTTYELGSIANSLRYGGGGATYSGMTPLSVEGGDETRPKAITYLACIKAYDVISDPNVLNAVEVVNEISRLESEKLAKTDIVAPGDAPMFACRAWVNFDGSTTPPTIRASGNVSSVVRTSTGIFTINLTSALTDSNYIINFCSVDIAGVGYLMPCIYRGTPATTSSFSILTTFQASSTQQQANPSLVTVSVFR